MSRSLVLGLGNRLTGADGFGPAVVDQLRSGLTPPGVDLVDAGSDLLAYIDRFREYDTVVLVDAVLDDSGRGIAVIPEETFSTWNETSPSAHELSAVGCVKLFRALQREADRPGPVITLVALMVPETHFHRAPTRPEIDAGSAAAYLATCGGAAV